MTMKVIRAGAPRMLTVRVRRCEVDVMREDLHDRRAAITGAATHAHAKSMHLCSTTFEHLLRAIRRGTPSEPTWRLAPVIRGAAVEAVERVRDAVATFAADSGARTPAEVRAVVDTASAPAATLVGLDHAENHAVDT